MKHVDNLDNRKINKLMAFRRESCTGRSGAAGAATAGVYKGRVWPARRVQDRHQTATMNAIALAAALTAFLGCIALGVRTDKSRRV